jgi:hypothetical protein
MDKSALKLAFASLRPAILDKSGEFKYILVDLTDPLTGDKLTLVRGSGKFEFHANILKHFKTTEFDPINDKNGGRFTATCPGGGWVRAEPNSIFLYFKSIKYGPGDHELAKTIIESDLEFEGVNIQTEGKSSAY